MEKSSKRTTEAIRKKEKIGIFGDYDVDGASATALLGNFFSSINLLIKLSATWPKPKQKTLVLLINLLS